LDPQIISAAANIGNSDTTKIIFKRLWPTMIFLVVMSLITCGAIYLFNRNNEVSKLVAFWIWFIVQIVVTSFGLKAFMADARILSASDRMQSQSLTE
jgi:hypothetical protein